MQKFRTNFKIILRVLELKLALAPDKHLPQLSLYLYLYLYTVDSLSNSKSKGLQEKFELSRLRIIKRFELSRGKKKIRIIKSFYYIFENMYELT